MNFERSSCNLLTANKEIVDQPEYEIVKSVISSMFHSGVLNLGAGYCISISEMLYSALKQQNIDCKMVECQLTITYYSGDMPEVRFVGFDQHNNPGEISSHVVIVTNTKIPMLIDASILHRLPPEWPVVVDAVESFDKIDDNVFANLDLKDHKIKLSYKEKTKQIIPAVHNRSFIDRISTDNKIFQRLKILTIFVIVAIVISTANAIRGFYDFYTTFYLENFWGPRTLEKIDRRLEKLENILDVPKDRKD